MKWITKVFLLSLISFSAIAAGVTEERGIFGDNFYEIDPGQYYRSSQLSAARFEKYIQTYGIRTVINLRGANPGQPWFDEEAAVLRKLQVTHVNIAMSASDIPHRRNLLALLEAFEKAPRPLLVHCKGGADRTGEASALYQMLYMQKSREEAMKMLSFKYGHLSSSKPGKDYFIQTVWQGLDWALQTYNPCLGQYQYYDIHSPECAGAL